MATDLLILTVYLICVVYVLYQMALSVEDKLEDQIEIVLEAESLQEAVNAQLGQQRFYQANAEVVTNKSISLLQLTLMNQDEAIGNVALQVAPQGKRPLAPPMSDLQVSIVNMLPNQQVFINWDNSSLAVYGGLAQRVIRKVPGRPIDLFQPQVMTVINPGQGVNVAVTGESLFDRPNDQTALETAPVLVDFGKIPALPPPMRTYSLRILMWVQAMTGTDRPALQLLLPFTFQIRLLPDHVALPILSWILNFFRKK